MKEQYPASSLETAMCVWEAVLEIMNGGAGHKGLRVQAQRIRQNMGTSALRLAVMEWVELIDAAWERDKASYSDPFDWGYVPEWLARHIDWSGSRPVYMIGARV